MTEDADALSVLQGCKVDVEQLRDMLQSHIDDEFTSIVNPSENLEVQPTSGFSGLFSVPLFTPSPLAVARQPGQIS